MRTVKPKGVTDQEDAPSDWPPVEPPTASGRNIDEKQKEGEPENECQVLDESALAPGPLSRALLERRGIGGRLSPPA